VGSIPGGGGPSVWSLGCPLPSPYVSWDRLQHPSDPNEDEAVFIMDGFLNTFIIMLFFEFLKVDSDTFFIYMK